MWSLDVTPGLSFIKWQLSNSINLKSVLLCLLFIYTFIHCLILYQMSVARRLWEILLGTSWSSGGFNIQLSVIHLWFLLDVCIFAYFVSKDLACKAVWRHGFLVLIMCMPQTVTQLLVPQAPAPSPFWLKWKLELMYGYLNVVVFSQLADVLSTHSTSR